MDIDLVNQAEIKPNEIPEVPKIDEVKRYEKIYEFSKEMFTYSENVIKSLEEKSRNNLTAATAIMGFAFLIRKPPEISTIRWFDLLAIILSAACVGYVYHFHIRTVKPMGVKMPSENQLQKLREETKYPNGVLRSNFENMQYLYGLNLKLIERKGNFVRDQQRALGAVLFLALIYILLSQVPTSVPQTGSLSSTWPTTTAPNSNPAPNQIQMPAPGPTTSTSTKAPTSGKATTVPAPATDPVTKTETGKP